MIRFFICMLLAGGLFLLPARGQTTSTAPAPAPAFDNKKPQADVRQLIEDSIKLLELKDYAGALRKVAGPIAEKLEKDGKLDHAAEVLRAGMGEELLKGLKTTRDLKAIVEDEGQTVVFDLGDKFPDAPRMTFRKWEKGWYLD